MRAKLPIVVISGIDGSGKTSVIESLKAQLENKGVSTRYAWLRYNHYLSKFVLAFCRFTGFTRYEYNDDTRVVYHQFYRSKLISWLFIILTWIDTLFASMIKVYIPGLLGKQVIICDRWITDIMIDLEVDTRVSFAENTNLYRWFMRLLPKHTNCIILLRNKSLVLESRAENRFDRNFPLRYQLYSNYEERCSHLVVHNTASIEEAVSRILKFIDIKVDNQVNWPSSGDLNE